MPYQDEGKTDAESAESSDFVVSVGCVQCRSELAARFAPVCLLGRTVVNNLFGPGEDPVGTVVRVKNFPLRVVGVVPSQNLSRTY